MGSESIINSIRSETVHFSVEQCRPRTASITAEDHSGRSLSFSSCSYRLMYNHDLFYTCLSMDAQAFLSRILSHRAAYSLIVSALKHTYFRNRPIDSIFSIAPRSPTYQRVAQTPLYLSLCSPSLGNLEKCILSFKRCQALFIIRWRIDGDFFPSHDSENHRRIISENSASKTE